jgi:hypothetical protein
MAAKVKAQISMEDNIVDNPELLKLLEDRQEKKQSASEYRKADKAARDAISKITTPMPYRVGKFIISKQEVAAKTVEFETGATERIAIKTIDGE